MSVVSIFTLIVFVTSKLIMLNIGDVYYIISKFFPEAAEKFVQTVFFISKQSGSLNIILILLAFYFSKDFFIALATAFSFVTQTQQKKKKNIYIMIFSLPVVVVIITLLYLFKFLIKLLLSYFVVITAHFKILFGEKFTQKLHDFLLYIERMLSFGFVFEFFVLFIFVFSAYYLMVNIQNITKIQIVYISLLVSMSVLVLKIGFGIMYTYLLSKNPLFVVMGSVFIITVWVKLMFDIVLIGARLIYYLEKASSKEAQLPDLVKSKMSV